MKYLGFILLFFIAQPIFSFQYNASTPTIRDPFSLLEAYGEDHPHLPESLKNLAKREYSLALKNLNLETSAQYSWFKNYLEGLIVVSEPLIRFDSAHFTLYVPKGAEFLKEYALPMLEDMGNYVEKNFQHRPKRKIIVEIYPDSDHFSIASTLSPQILENSGAIGICKFHRLMIMSPQALPLGYRWMDALAHEYMHLIINELSGSRAELWIHEGTARYFETAYRLNPPTFLSPDQKTKLIEAKEKGTLVPFKKMSPSMVYLKDQDEVSLAFGQVSHAVCQLVEKKGASSYGRFLRGLKSGLFETEFKKHFEDSPEEFEILWKEKLGGEKWEKSVGAMSDKVIFGAFEEENLLGASAQGMVRLGDRMRQRGLHEAALIEYEKALNIEPDNAILLLKAARSLLAQGNKEKAITYLRWAIKKNPNYGTPYIELAPLVGDSDAIDFLKEANSINPFNPQIHKLLSEAYERVGESKKSIFELTIFESLMSQK
ncbi:MAG: tetratricopeptide repeat protein [Elusimicrobiota bacterium]